MEITRSIKQLPPGSPLVGEEWISGPWAVLGFVPALIETLFVAERVRESVIENVR